MIEPISPVFLRTSSKTADIVGFSALIALERSR
jgi:hypothetical protein